MKTLLDEPCLSSSSISQSLIASYSEVQHDGSYRMMIREDCADDIERTAFDDIAALQLLVSRVKTAQRWKPVHQRTPDKQRHKNAPPAREGGQDDGPVSYRTAECAPCLHDMPGREHNLMLRGSLVGMCTGSPKGEIRTSESA